MRQMPKIQTNESHSTSGNYTYKKTISIEVIGIDIIGPLQSSEGYKYILIAIDYFTRWPMVKKNKEC